MSNLVRRVLVDFFPKLRALRSSSPLDLRQRAAFALKMHPGPHKSTTAATAAN